jgi:hypothetical protein
VSELLCQNCCVRTAVSELLLLEYNDKHTECCPTYNTIGKNGLNYTITQHHTTQHMKHSTNQNACRFPFTVRIRPPHLQKYGFLFRGSSHPSTDLSKHHHLGKSSLLRRSQNHRPPHIRRRYRSYMSLLHCHY